MSDMPRSLLLALVLGVVVAGQAPPPSVPLRVGLTVVTAISSEKGDYESIKRITAVSDKSVTLSYTADNPPDENPFGDDDSKDKDKKPRTVRTRRTVLTTDLQSAHEYAQVFSEQHPETFPGTTAIGLSAAILADLKSKGSSAVTVQAEGLASALGGMLSGLLGQKSKELDALSKWSGTITRDKTGPSTLTVLVNGAATPLPVVHAKGTVGDDNQTAEFYFLDDPRNPLSLKFTIGETTLQVVRIEFPLDQPAQTASGAAKPAGGGAGTGGGGGNGDVASTSAATIASALESTGSFAVYGIYFDFGSDVIKPESDPVLREIGKVMADHPTWALSVDGHTDNIGGDAYNLDLSKRRAAAVKLALVTRFKIADARLATGGYGASRPKATNATLEGRAQNRRVELVKK